MSKRDFVALILLAISGLLVGFGCLVTYGVLREYADVCGRTSALEQVWASGAGLGPLVAAVSVVLALVVASVARRSAIRVAAVGLVLLAVVGATIGGIAGINGKKAQWEDDPATYGVCGGYHS